LLERLPAAEAAVLASEISGERPPQLTLRLRQMRDLGVFSAVAQSVGTEISSATAALRGFAHQAPTPLLLGLCDVLETQVAGLQRTG